ncbi:hypothetical protein [Lactobacillus sp. UCMA15818]|uniref:hypothetical protein n=1 Tax=Lactobacillaceae TaxID=33958 RepID=UPI0025AFDC19|nr:hypothetical protein [Lactobacillus sp. UCMA15818]MDN2454144.1 hypothetical protein [Lactobacillus sp. UCMA15818]
MEIKVKDFINQVETDEFTKIVLNKIEVKEVSELKTNFMENLLAKFESAISREKIVRAVQPIAMNNEPVEVVLETGVINLPFTNINRVDNFFDVENTVPLVTNLVIISSNLNASDLFIRSYSNTSDLKSDTAKLVADTLLSMKQIQVNLEENEDGKPQES